MESGTRKTELDPQRPQVLQLWKNEVCFIDIRKQKTFANISIEKDTSAKHNFSKYHTFIKMGLRELTPSMLQLTIMNSNQDCSA